VSFIKKSNGTRALVNFDSASEIKTFYTLQNAKMPLTCFIKRASHFISFVCIKYQNILAPNIHFAPLAPRTLLIAKAGKKVFAPPDTNKVIRMTHSAQFIIRLQVFPITKMDMEMCDLFITHGYQFFTFFGSVC